HDPAGPDTSESGLADAGRGRLYVRAVHGRLGAAAGALSAGQSLGELGGTRRPRRPSLYPGALQYAGLRDLCTAGVMYACEAAAGAHPQTPSPTAIRGPAGRPSLVCG